MSASIEIPYAIGTVLWWRGSGYREEHITCPTCCGTKSVTMILGDGTQVAVDCEGCGIGYEGPRGWITEHRYKHEPEPFTCALVVSEGADGFAYSSGEGRGRVNAKDLHTDRDACQAECDRLNAERAEFETDNMIRGTKRAREKMVWSVHYWRRQRADHVRDIERIDARLRVIALRATNGGGDGTRTRPAAGGARIDAEMGSGPPAPGQEQA